MKYISTTIIATLVALMAHQGVAKADSTSLLTLGFGQSVGVAHVMPVNGGTNNSIVSEMNLRLRMLTVLGFDFNYNVAGEQSVGNGEVYASNYRMSALLYLVPTDVMSLYLAAGAGASEMGDLTSSEMTDKSYHGGGGLELYVGDHLALNTEFLMLVPEVSRIVVSKQPLSVDETGNVDWSSADEPGVSDYVSSDNFQVTFGMKYYF